MKTAASLIWFSIVGFCQSSAPPSLTVCVQPYGDTLRAREVASRIYAGIGVKLVWRLGYNGCPQRAVRIEFSTSTPTSKRPGALGYAMPFADASIVVFYDRVAEQSLGDRRFFPKLLGYVLAHEIGHALERIDRHSTSGVMKGKWVSGDFADISLGCLRFEPIDANLILEGVVERTNTPVGVARMQ